MQTDLCGVDQSPGASYCCLCGCRIALQLLEFRNHAVDLCLRQRGGLIIEPTRDGIVRTVCGAVLQLDGDACWFLSAGLQWGGKTAETEGAIVETAFTSALSTPLHVAPRLVAAAAPISCSLAFLQQREASVSLAASAARNEEPLRNERRWAA